MVVTFTPATLDRIETQRREEIERLASRASHFITEPDPVTAGGYIVRSPKVPARIALVSADGECSCRHYLLWSKCKHSALVEVRHGVRAGGRS